MKKITFIVLSYNRPCQLDAAISSMKKFFVNWQNHNIVVLYRSTNDKFKQGYELVKQRHNDLIYVEENNFRINMDFILNTYKTDYLVMMCDDDIWKEPFNTEDHDFQFFDLNKDKGICCFSLRMHPRISKCYTAGNIDTHPPKQFLHENPYVWQWTNEELKGDWNYPNSVDCHIFVYDDMYNLLMRRDIVSVSHIEVIISQLAPRSMKPFMACSNKSAIFNIPLNAVQEICRNINMGITIDYLNEKYLEGYIIDIDNYVGFDNISPHQELPITLKRIT